MKQRKLSIILLVVLMLIVSVSVLVACKTTTPDGEKPNEEVPQGDWKYSYSWEGGKCTATRVVEGTDKKETETANGVLTVEVPATVDKDGKGYYTVKFKNADFNTNYKDGNKETVIPKGSDFEFAKAGLQTYFFEETPGKYYYAEMTISPKAQSGWVGFIHNTSTVFSATDGTYFYDAVSYKAGKNYEHTFGSVIGGTNAFSNVELAESYEGADKSGYTGAVFASTGMTVCTLRNNDLIHLFINGKRVATYLVDEEIATQGTVPALYFNTNSTFYSGAVKNISVVSGEEKTKSKLSALMADNNGFMYSNSQNWNKNGGMHTDATFDKDSFTYKYDETTVIPDGSETNDRRFLTGVTDRVFLSGNYYYQYEISGDMTMPSATGVYGLLFNWINSAQRSGIYYYHEAMFCMKAANGLEKIHFDAGKGTNGDGVGGWTGNTAYGGSDALKDNEMWQAAYKAGLIVRIERVDYVAGESATYKMSVTCKSDPSLTLVSGNIVVNAEDKTPMYGGYDWILFGTQSLDCTISNVTYGKL